ncbi:MAG: FkbM family methyltransferase [Candidatus Micrarchaeota archaeon]|nr:FkbM family methyltransferase [Candidatus Micrarchaeota archaeon]
MEKGATGKLSTLARLDMELLTSSNIGALERLRFLLAKYYAVAADRREIRYLGRTFHYDGRLAPIPLQMYPKLVHFLSSKINMKKVRTVLDIGANVGQFSFTLKALYPHTGVYCFEPNKTAFRILEDNMSGFRGTRLFNYGIGRPGRRRFYSSPSSSGLGSFYKKRVHQFGHKGDVEESTVNCIGLDHRSRSGLGIPGKADLIKIDVEGAETEVLRHLKGMSCRYLLVECNGNDRAGRIVDEIRRAFRADPVLLGTKALHKGSASMDCLFRLE